MTTSKRCNLKQRAPPDVLYRVLEEGFELDSPEAIAKWRESRKRNFPTPSNIEKKISDKAETVRRGEKFIPKRLNKRIYSYPIKIEKGRDNQYQHQFVNTSWVNRNLPENKSEVLLLETYYAKVIIDRKGTLIGKKLTDWNPDFTDGLANGGAVEDEQDINQIISSTGGDTNDTSADVVVITDDEDDIWCSQNGHIKQFIADTPVVIPVSEILQSNKSESIIIPKISVGLQSLVAYGTDSELEDGEIPDEIKNVVETEQSTISDSKLENGQDQAHVSSINDDNEIPPKPNANSNKQDSNSIPNNRPGRKRRRNKKSKFWNGKNDNNQKKPKQGPPPVRRRMRPSDREPTLLRRLLDDQICEERNAVLCACRFLVQHNFLEGFQNSTDLREEFIDCVKNSNSQED